MPGTSSRAWRFYAALPSYFSAKVRPALRVKGIPFEEIPPTPDSYREVIIPRTGLAFIPVLISPDDETLQDTSEILDALEQRFPKPALYPATPVQRVTALLLELYADEFLVLPAMHYRWSFPESEAQARRDFAASNGDPAAANRFADRMQGSIRALGVVPESIPAIEGHLADLLDGLSAHFAAQPFLLGTRPSLADCALMGPLHAHLLLDAVPGRLLRARAPRVCDWIGRMDRGEGADGAFLPGDALAPTLRPLLDLAGRDAVPVILDTVRDFERWADARPGDVHTPPRGVGIHASELRGARFSRYTSPYTLWMLQRPLDAYLALGGPERARVDAALAGTGLVDALRYAPRHRLGKRRFQLVFEAPPARA
jgi:glutathione S-transferase